MEEKKKIFLVFNTSYFGDVLLCDGLCRNIKNLWPESKVVFVVRKQFAEVAQNMDAVDDIVIFDKYGEHKGLFGIFRFIFNFPYKKPYCSFVTYRNFRNKFISILVGAKHVIREDVPAETIPNWLKHIYLLKHLTKKRLEYFPMKYNATDVEGRKFLPEGKRYIAICATTKNREKDIHLDVVKELIGRLNENGFTPVITGAGKVAEEYSEKLKNTGGNFIDLTGKTTIYELGGVLKCCDGLISADTGTMHLGCAVSTPVTAVFYQKDKLVNWSPSALYYNCSVISANQTAENISQNIMRLING